MSNIDVAQRYLSAAYGGDMDGARALLHPEVELVMGGGGAIAGRHSGVDGFFAAFGRMMEVTRGTYRMIDQVSWMEDADRALLIATEQAERDGSTVTFDRVITYEITDGLIRRVRVYEGDPAVADAAFTG